MLSWRDLRVDAKRDDGDDEKEEEHGDDEKRDEGSKGRRRRRTARLRFYEFASYALQNWFTVSSSGSLRRRGRRAYARAAETRN